MPELPEVETIKQNLSQLVDSKLIVIKALRSDIIKSRDFELDSLAGRKIMEIKRRGKYLILSLEDCHNVVFHMGMSGRLFIAKQTDFDKHVHMLVEFNNGIMIMFRDPRRFGGVWLLRSPESYFAKLGVEPLSDDFNADYLRSITSKRKTSIKSFLLNQKFIVGIGNIYADEALFRAGIKPQRTAGQLNDDELNNLVSGIKKTLAEGIMHNGTTFRDYRDGNNQAGEFQEFLQVYGRYQQPCVQCHSPLAEDRIAGRRTVFCHHCQI